MYETLVRDYRYFTINAYRKVHFFFLFYVETIGVTGAGEGINGKRKGR